MKNSSWSRDHDLSYGAHNKRSFLPETFRPPIQESQDCERQINGLCAGASFGHYTCNYINILDNSAAIDQPMYRPAKLLETHNVPQCCRV